jgi:hypothetical protein
MTGPRGVGRLRPVLLVSAAVFLFSGTAPAGDLQKAIEMTIQANKKAAASQKRVDKLSEDSTELVGQYRTVLQQIESVRAYNAQVEKLLDSQREEIKSLNNQIENATAVGREITPLMLRMVDALSNFVELDVPFLIEERRDRVAKLREMMDRADVADSEKFRRILEAYLVEVDFGRTIEAYEGALKKDAGEITVNFLRVGRVAFVYMTLDEMEAGVWNREKKAWEVLPGENRGSIKKGLRIARKYTASDLIPLPIFAPEEAK